MKSEKEILEELKKVMADERLHCQPANVFSNAPLALIQTELNASVKALKCVHTKGE